MKRYNRDNTQVRVSRSVKDMAYKILEYKEKFINVNGIPPTNKEISKELEIPEYYISYSLDSLKSPVSLFQPIYNDGGDTIYLMDQLASKKGLYDKDTLLSLKKALAKLKSKERDILLDRYFIGKTQVEMANKYGISQAQISRIEKNALENVRRLIR